MDKYEIGTRLRGYSKDYLNTLTCEISKKFNLNEGKRLAPPHLTFLRPFYTNDENKLIQNFDNVLFGYNNKLVTYTLEGFGVFENNEKVFYGRIKENPQIEEIISNLEKSLENQIEFIHTKMSLPTENKINLHSSIISKGANNFYPEIKEFLEKQIFLEITHPLLRVYLVKNDLLLREFDFYLNKGLERWDAKNPFIYRETENAFEEKTGYLINKDGIMLPLPRKFQKINL